MNGTVIDIIGINVNVNPIEMQDSSDMAHIITISDGKRKVQITVIYGNITQLTNEEVRSNID
jgi:hypothetical protein